ncbi:ABC transporter permease [Stappia sp. BW2]|uniref:ABC transporter permease n=1 Tax=Stappia sp. BW2 TaxID=2592622 RepID=UPI0011DEBF11|nr:ABC transporter permease [Stappia sp. BW2]TYC64751.1 ABC transporter permease [Stappia sp. BW2]
MYVSQRTRAILHGTLGLALMLICWEIIGTYKLAGYTWPSLTDVVTFATEPTRLGLFSRAISATIQAVVLGYVIGAAVGFISGAIITLVPAVKTSTDSTAAVINAIPPIALGPLLIVLLGYSAAPVALAALHVFFIIYVATVAGFQSATQTHRDVFQALGASKGTVFYRLFVPAAVPNITTGLRMAAPSAMIGAILGEWFGAPRGLGVLIVSAMQNFQIQLLWSAVLFASILSLSLFAFFGLVERLATEKFKD